MPKRREQPAPGSPGFAEVVVDDMDGTAGRHSDRRTPLRVMLPSGAVVEVSGRDQLPLLDELLHALSSRRSC